jgi:3-isopropylmalate dehydrogenase
MLIDWLGDKHGRPELSRAAATIETAVDDTLSDASTRTPDVGGSLGTKAFTDALIGNLAD